LSFHYVIGDRTRASKTKRLAMRASLAEVAVIDYAMTDALSLCEDLASDRLRIVVVDVPPHERTAIDVLAAGASGIVYSGAARTEVIRAVRAVHSGLIWAPPHVVAATWRKAQREVTTSRMTETTIVNRLSARERDVFRLAAAGLGSFSFQPERATTRSAGAGHRAAARSPG
jgi:DNA-binding NarL/FixJ family response regulator